LISTTRQIDPDANQLIRQARNALVVRRFRLARNQHDQPHSHPWHQLLFPRSGMLRTRTPDIYYFIPPNRGALIPAGVTHESWALADSEFTGIYFNPGSFSVPLRECRIIEISGFMAALIEQAIRIGEDWRNRPTAPDQRILDVFFDQLGASRRIDLAIALPDDKRLLPIVREVLATPKSTTSLSTWAETVGASERTISRIFRKKTGLTFSRWRQKVRLITALSMLEEGQATQDIALSVGYGSASAFIYCFRKEFGVTPQQYLSAPAN
jgi:AraC-like DNA-binding protein